jgi:DNA-binding MarR family transcriptional regulator
MVDSGDRRSRGRSIGPRSQAQLEATTRQRLPRVNPSLVEIFLYSSGITKVLEKVLAQTVRPYGIDGTQLTMLFVLWCAEPPYQRSPTELHRLLVLSPAGTSHTIRRLTESGLVSREADESDGRLKGVRLTDTGLETVQACMQDLGSHLAAIFAEVPADRLASFASEQREITAVLSRSPLGRPIDPGRIL